MDATFERDPDGTFFLCDAESKNATRVNDVLIDPTALVSLRPGDEVRFGLVEAMVCAAAMLFDAIACL